ncbi:MAG: TolC family protein, partial [Calditrichaeota bacterium]
MKRPGKKEIALMNRIVRWGWLLILLAVSLWGCGTGESVQRKEFADTFTRHTGRQPRMGEGTGFHLPEGVDVSDSLSRDEAVAIALFNNAAFQSTLADLEISFARLQQAGLIANPVFSVLFPIGPKQLEAALSWPLAVFWQRPLRIKVARNQAAVVAQELVAHGLELIREVDHQLAAVTLAQRQVALLTREQEAAAALSDLAARRWQVGEISRLAWRNFQADSLLAYNRAWQMRQQLQQARHRLAELLGLPANRPLPPVQPARIRLPLPALPAEDSLLTLALAARPEVRAAELQAQEAGARAGLATAEVFQLIGVLDANFPRDADREVGPGLEVSLPLLNWNGGRRREAREQMKQALWRYVQVRQAITRQLRDAYSALRSAQNRVRLWRSELLPHLREAARQTLL